MATRAATRYTLLDLLRLAVRMAAPFLDPLVAEWRAARKPVAATGRAVTPVVIEATPATVVLTGAAADWEADLDDRQAEYDRWAAEHAATDWDAEHRRMHAAEDAEMERQRVWDEERAAETPAVRHTVPVAETSPAERPEPRYVRRGAGKGTRYVVAASDESGERYRRLVRAGRSRYEPCR